MKVALYKRGYFLLHPRIVASRKGGGLRGALHGEKSSSSFRRFREWCITHDCPGECWGLTLTVPGLTIVDNQQFKVIHHKLCVFANSHVIPFVWRVELQTRGQPHLHLVLFGTVESAIRVMLHWYKLLDSLELVLNRERVYPDHDDLVFVSRAFMQGSCHACDLQSLTGDFRVWRYLVSHMSKSKSSQLGWSGRNWGVCNRSYFRRLDSYHLSLDDRTSARLIRWINRLYCGVPSKNRDRRYNKFFEILKTKKHYTRLEQGLSGIPIFPTWQKRCLITRRGSLAMVGNPDTVRRMLDYLLPDLPF